MSKKQRDKNGRFVKGNSVGNRFDENNQPSNPGRKPSRFRQILEELEFVGESLSLEDYKKIAARLLSLNAKELSEVANDSKTPIAVVVIANAISGDLNNQRLDNLEKLLDRLFNKATSKHVVENKITPISRAEALKAREKISE